MYFNNAQCDVYIGTGAGKKLMEEMASAERSVKIVSPFLSGKLVQGLIALYEKGVQVKLITTEPEKVKLRLLQDLIAQHVHVDRKAHHQRKTLKKLLWTGYVLMGMGLMSAWFFLVQKDLFSVLFTMSFLGVVALSILGIRYSLKRKKVYSYSYEPIFPMRVIRPFNAFGQRTTYLHSKIYIIDDNIAYLGSLNFTHNGTENNYETRVRLTDDPSVKKIVQEFHYLMDGADFPELEPNLCGPWLFAEPVH